MSEGRKKILMVDDVALNHATARDVLRDTYDVYEALSAKEGFEILEKIIYTLNLDLWLKYTDEDLKRLSESWDEDGEKKPF